MLVVGERKGTRDKILKEEKRLEMGQNTYGYIKNVGK